MLTDMRCKFVREECQVLTERKSVPHLIVNIF
jgi:hypothetical protein